MANELNAAIPRLRILLVEDEASIARTLRAVLTEEGHTVTVSNDGAQAMSLLDTNAYDTVISDIRLPNVDGLTIFNRVRREAPFTPIILMSAYGTIAEAVRVMKEKAAHYLAKPFDLHELVDLVENIAHERSIREQLAMADVRFSQEPEDQLIIGNTPAISLIKKSLVVIAKSKASVLITGESGSGKDLVAHAIHQHSPRAGGPFVAVNCAALPDTLLEAELFGHEKGAFTGAMRRREGRFSAAHGGTLFLDEVGDMSATAQAKLLRAIETGRYEPLGSNATEKVDVRVISATNVDLQTRVEEGRFRADLYYRLKVFRMRVPALRERRGDLPLLIKHFCERAIGPDAKPVQLTPRAWAALNQHPFPGNVRELQHAIEHAIVLAEGEDIDVVHLPEEIRGLAAQASPAEATTSLPEAMREFEREFLVRTLTAAGGQRSRAAELLGISRKTLWAKLRQYGISSDDVDADS